MAAFLCPENAWDAILKKPTLPEKALRLPLGRMQLVNSNNSFIYIKENAFIKKPNWILVKPELWAKLPPTLMNVRGLSFSLTGFRSQPSPRAQRSHANAVAQLDYSKVASFAAPLLAAETPRVHPERPAWCKYIHWSRWIEPPHQLNVYAPNLYPVAHVPETWCMSSMQRPDGFYHAR
ncbi:hypothetical protein [Alcaligenes sp. SDU_A2]|uniref:hypothetical protein n=1 Tax=Alcaligenes sp. SDU_A2 TaxID=3136634 RepID=UPI00311DCAAC